MATTIDDFVPMTDQDFDARLTSALAGLEARSSVELTDEVIAQGLLGASNSNLSPEDLFIARAQTAFTPVNAMKVTKIGSSKPTADGATAYQWLGVSTGGMVYTTYSGFSRFVAKNSLQFRGNLYLVVLFFKGDGDEPFAIFVGNAVPSPETYNRGYVEWTS